MQWMVRCAVNQRTFSGIGGQMINERDRIVSGPVFLENSVNEGGVGDAALFEHDPIAILGVEWQIRCESAR